MRKFYSFLVLISLSIGLQAQVINFVDSNFKTVLLSFDVEAQVTKDLNGNWCKVDANNDGEIEVSEAENLSFLSIDQSGIKNFDEIKYFKNLTYLNCAINAIQSIDLTNLRLLEYLDCSSNNVLANLKVNNLENLSYINCEFNQLVNIDLTGLKSLRYLHCYYNKINEINISDLNSIEEINLDYNQLKSLTVSNSSIQKISCEENQIKNINVSNCINLVYLKCPGNEIESINIFSTQLTLSTLIFNPEYLIQLCCNTDVYESFFIYFDENNYFATVTAGENCLPLNQSLVVLRYSENSCNQNNPPIKKFNVNVNNSSQNLDYNFYGENNYYIFSKENIATIKPKINNDYFISIPEFYQVDYTQGNFQKLEFCLNPKGKRNDLEVSIIPIELARPGFESYYKIVYKNVGNTMLNGFVELTFQDEFMDLLTSLPTVDSQITNKLTWNFTNLSPYESREILFTMKLNTPTDPNFPLNNGDILNFLAFGKIQGTEENLKNNIAELKQQVVNSFDPNDKILLEGTSVSTEKIGDFVNYRIRFENTGTANAINITIEDTLDTSIFDPSTLEIVDSNYPVKAVIEGSLVKFHFYNINLPFDDANNDGYVIFKIKTLPTLLPKQSFSNKADIYFDYNAPITTNNYTSIFKTLGVDDLQNINTISVLPNPIKSSFQIVSEDVIKKVTLYDISGKLMKVFIGENQSYNISELKSGMYLIQVYTDNAVISEKILKQ